MENKIKLLIDGQSREGKGGDGDYIYNPASGEKIGIITKASKEDLDEVLEVAQRGLQEWRKIVPWERGRIMKNAAEILRRDIDKIAPRITIEQGKILKEAKEEILRSADFLEWGGEEARRIKDITIHGRETGNTVMMKNTPIGVVAAFTPWNFPMAQAAKKFAGALGAGCSIICKPSQEAPGSVLDMANALLEAGVPKATISIVFGSASEISSHLIASPIISKISFTGSIPIGKLLAKATSEVMKPYTMELGGHAPTIICGDMNPEETADFLTKAKFKNAGQICLSPTRFYVEANIYDRFVNRLVENTRNWRVGDGMESTSQMGPIVSERRLKAIMELAEDAKSKGAKIRVGGNRIGDRGYFFEPTIITDLPENAKILHEEPFGPIVPVMPFEDEKKMLELANGLEFGLSAYVFTNDHERQNRICEALEYGAVGINDVVTHHPEVQLGGWKESGVGYEGGPDILTPYIHQKFVNLRKDLSK